MKPLIKFITKNTLFTTMIDFDPKTSLSQDVFEYMTENQMYKIYDSEEESITFALMSLGQELSQVKIEASEETKEGVITSNSPNKLTYTLKVEEFVASKYTEEISNGRVRYVKKLTGNGARSHKVRFS